MTNAGGDWQDMPVSTHGDEAILEMGSDGLPRVMLGNYCGFLGDKGIYYATTSSPTGPFVVEPIPGATPDDYGLVDMVLGRRNRPQAIYWHFTESDSRNLHLALDDGGWTSTELVAPSLNVVSIATGPDGAADLFRPRRHRDLVHDQSRRLVQLATGKGCGHGLVQRRRHRCGFFRAPSYAVCGRQL